MKRVPTASTTEGPVALGRKEWGNNEYCVKFWGCLDLWEGAKGWRQSEHFPSAIPSFLGSTITVGSAIGNHSRAAFIGPDSTSIFKVKWAPTVALNSHIFFANLDSGDFYFLRSKIIDFVRNGKGHWKGCGWAMGLFAASMIALFKASVSFIFRLSGLRANTALMNAVYRTSLVLFRSRSSDKINKSFDIFPPWSST